MMLDATAREANVVDSWKKYLVDNLYKTEGIDLLFDRNLSTPKIQGQTDTVTRWVTANFGSISLSEMSDAMLMMFCCTRKDPEYYRLGQLRDTVMGYLTDNTQTDGMRRITFYRSRSTGAWIPLDNGIIVQDINESQRMDGPDGTKYKILNVRYRFSSKV